MNLNNNILFRRFVMSKYSWNHPMSNHYLFIRVFYLSIKTFSLLKNTITIQTSALFCFFSWNIWRQTAAQIKIKLVFKLLRFEIFKKIRQIKSQLCGDDSFELWNFAFFFLFFGWNSVGGHQPRRDPFEVRGLADVVKVGGLPGVVDPVLVAHIGVGVAVRGGQG